jgi:hypothetical protein
MLALICNSVVIGVSPQLAAEKSAAERSLLAAIKVLYE